jgi:hypothetical protein
MFEKSKEAHQSVNDAAKDHGEAAREVTLTIKAVKAHFARNRDRYILAGTAATSVVLGGAAVAAFGKIDTKQTVDSFKLIHIQWKSPNINVALVKRELPQPIPVHYKPTGENFASIRRAAQMLGMNASEISKDAQGSQSLFERLPDSVFA